MAFLLCAIFIQAGYAEEWYLPDGQTMTTQPGSTPPVSGARLYPYPNTVHAQPKSQGVTPAPSSSQIQGLLPRAVAMPIPTSPEFYKAVAGQPGGQCVEFAKEARPDLKPYAPYGSANRMPEIARANGFEVNGTPRAGSVLVVSKPEGSSHGHAEVVTSAMNLGDRYILTIMDSNANEDEIISARTVYYTPSDSGTFGNYGKYEEVNPGLTKLAKDLVVMGFIQGKVAATPNQEGK